MKAKFVTESNKEEFEKKLNAALKEIGFGYVETKFSTCNTTAYIFYSAIIIYN